MLESSKKLSIGQLEDLKRSYDRDGYFIARGAISPDRLSELHKALTQAFDAAAESGELRDVGGLTSGHLNCYPGAKARFVYDELQQIGIIDLVKELHPHVARMPNVGCNFNIPGSHAQHYHTDRPFSRDFMILNVALVDTVIENGAIDMIPGTHKRFYRYKEFVVERPYRNHKRLPLNRGDVLVRNSNVWHRGMPNRTSVPRPMLAFTWEDGGSNHDDPFNIDGGNIRFLSNWYKTTPIGRMREQVFVRVPVIYSAFRLARSFCDRTY
jgi:hypothetical protein